MKMNVRWSDIRDGKSSKSTQCMVALALKRELGATYASVGYKDATVVINGQPTKIYLPRRVSNLIHFWDRFHFVLPFSFEFVCEGFQAGQGLQPEACATATESRDMRSVPLAAAA
jgi:hypothetical protein